MMRTGTLCLFGPRLLYADCALLLARFCVVVAVSAVVCIQAQVVYNFPMGMTRLATPTPYLNPHPNAHPAIKAKLQILRHFESPMELFVR